MPLKSSEKSQRTYELDSRNINIASKNDNYTVTSLFRKPPKCRVGFLLLGDTYCHKKWVIWAKKAVQVSSECGFGHPRDLVKSPW